MNGYSLFNRLVSCHFHEIKNEGLTREMVTVVRYFALRLLQFVCSVLAT